MADYRLNFPFANGRAVITLDQFLTNPTGKGSSMMARRKEIKADLEKRYYALIKNCPKNMLNYKIFVDKKKEVYIFYFQIPSESFDNFFYDVVLQFVPEDKKAMKFGTINDYGIDFFSNSPHMTYTYTYVLNKNGIIVDWMKKKYSPIALKKAPQTTNPVELFGFEKSCYYACMYINERKLHVKEHIIKSAIPFDSSAKNSILNAVIDQETKALQYNILKKKTSESKRKAKEKKMTSISNSEMQQQKKKDAKKSGFKPLVKNTKKKPSMKSKQFKSVFKK
jgi:hypothetical protein